MQDKVFIFSKEEFMILAAVSRIRQMYGFSLREDIEEQEVVLTMQKLTEKGLLFSDGGKFQLPEMIENMFLQIKNVKTTIDVHKRSGRKCIIYIGDCGVKVSVSRNRDEMLEIQCIPIDEIWRCLTEEGWIPESKEKI